DAQLADAVLNVFLQRLDLNSFERRLGTHALERAGDPRKIGQGLVVQVHANRLPCVLQLFGEIQRTDAQALGTGLGFHLQQLALTEQFALLQREEVRGQNVNDDTGIGDV